MSISGRSTREEKWSAKLKFAQLPEVNGHFEWGPGSIVRLFINLSDFLGDIFFFSSCFLRSFLSLEHYLLYSHRTWFEATISVKSVNTSSIQAPFFVTQVHYTSPPSFTIPPSPYQYCSRFREVENSKCSEGVIIMAEKIPFRVNVSTTFDTYCSPQPSMVHIWETRSLGRVLHLAWLRINKQRFWALQVF